MEEGTIHIIEGEKYERRKCPDFVCTHCDLYDKDEELGRTCRHPQGLSACTDVDTLIQGVEEIDDYGFHFKRV